jgi:hypothetical protein
MKNTFEMKLAMHPLPLCLLTPLLFAGTALGEDILLELSAVNLITKPPMSVQVMIYPPSGMSVTGSEFVKSGAGIYTTTYTLNPGDGKDIEGWSGLWGHFY